MISYRQASCPSTDGVHLVGELLRLELVAAIAQRQSRVEMDFDEQPSPPAATAARESGMTMSCRPARPCQLPVPLHRFG